MGFGYGEKISGVSFPRNEMLRLIKMVFHNENERDMVSEMQFQQ